MGAIPSKDRARFIYTDHLMKRLLNYRSLIAAGGFVLVVLLWIFFAPVQIGGHAFYVIINGNSMEPNFHKGDLVVLRTAQYYEVGEIVAYRYPQLGNVFHRIIGINGNLYQMKGDNNSWIDGYQPVKHEIIARYWFAIKGLGKPISVIKSPWIIAIITGVFCLIMGLSMLQSSKKNQKQKKSAGNKAFTSIGYGIAGWRDGYYWLAYALGLAAIALGIFAFTRPLLKSVKDNVAFQQNGIFNYSGKANQAVYNSKDFSTGDPVFMALSCNVDFVFDYSLSTPEPFIGGGSYQMTAALLGSNGWKRNFELTPVTQFNGGAFQSKAALNVCTLRDLITSTETLTEVQGIQYSVAVTPNVKIAGQFASLSVDQSFNPALTFNLNQQQFFIPVNSAAEENPFKPTLSRLLITEHSEENTLSIFSLQIPVRTARPVAISLFLLAALGLLIPVLIFKNSGQENDKLKAKMLIGPMLVETLSSPVSGQERIVDLLSFEDLAQLAERLGSTVFFHQQALYIDYLVKESNLVYRFRQASHLLDSKNETSFQHEIAQAIKNNELVLFFQPIQSMQTGKITQIEALLRWNHPEKGLLTAAEFLPLAEKSSAINLIDNWVLQTACTQLRKWQDAGFTSITLSINISGQQLRDPDLAGTVEDALLENQIKANRLSIEISMDQLVFDAAVLNNLKAIKQLGVIITVKSADRNAMEKLHNLENVDQLKIGQTMVGQVITNAEVSEATQYMIGEAHKNKVGVIAAGVETSEQMGFFRLNACDEVQGYIVSHPLSEKDIDILLLAGKNAK